MLEVLLNRLGGLSLPSKSVVRLTDCPDMTLDVYRGRKTTMQQQCNKSKLELLDFEMLILPHALHYVDSCILSSPEPKAQGELSPSANVLRPSSVVRRASCVVNNCFKRHLL